MARQRTEGLLLPQLLKKIAPTIGARVYVEPEWGVAGQITFRDGKKRYFRYNTLDLNPVGSADVAKDKDYANIFMKRMGYRTVPGRAFYSNAWCEQIGSKRDIHAAYRYARKIGLGLSSSKGFPVIVKPND